MLHFTEENLLILCLSLIVILPFKDKKAVSQKSNLNKITEPVSGRAWILTYTV